MTNNNATIHRIFDERLTARQPTVTKLLTNAKAQDRLAHAYLLVGRAEADKWQLARELGCYINCAHVAGGEPERACVLQCDPEHPEAELKSGCQNCRWIWEQKHPQAWLVLGGEGTKSGKIAVEKARLLSDELAKESQYVRIVVVENASQETFHRPAANALLKTIEDPKVSCLFMLFANSVDDVLPTIVSRCQVLPLNASDSLGQSLKKRDLGKFPPDAVRMAKEGVEQHIHRHDAQGLSRSIEFAKSLNEQFDEDFSSSDCVDLLLALEIDRVARKVSKDPTHSRYTQQLVELSEKTKDQLLHYVSPKAAMETFIVSWWKLASTLPR